LSTGQEYIDNKEGDMEDNAKDANNDAMNDDVNAPDNNNATCRPRQSPRLHP
jgi:hypothetical protein